MFPIAVIAAAFAALTTSFATSSFLVPSALLVLSPENKAVKVASCIIQSVESK